MGQEDYMEDAPEASDCLKDTKGTLTSNMLDVNGVHGRRPATAGRAQLQDQNNVEPPHVRGEVIEPTKPQDPTTFQNKCKPRRQLPQKTTSPKGARMTR